MTNQLNKIETAILERANELYKVDIGVANEFFDNALNAQFKYCMSNIGFWMEYRNLDLHKQNVNDDLIKKVVNKINKTTKGKGASYVHCRGFIVKASKEAIKIIND